MVDVEIRVGQPRNGMVDIVRLSDELEVWTVPVKSVPTAIRLLQYDEAGCLFARVDIAA